MTAPQLEEIQVRAAAGESKHALAPEFGVTKHSISYEVAA
jgi:DNA-binding XRE family transcriptional regulator